MSAVLMYHAIFADGDTSNVDAEDLPYALSVSEFTRQLDALASKPVGLFNANSINQNCLSTEDQQASEVFDQIVITFDDGHLSNLSLAAPLLRERNLPAYFFITSDFINKRPGFLTNEELSELSDMPGVCIGSHGRTHRFFDEMSETDTAEELLSSRLKLESWTGKTVASMSFPGGRFKRQTLAQMAKHGYVQWFGSTIGLVNDRQFLPSSDLHTGETHGLRVQSDQRPINRLAIRRSTQMTEFQRMINQDNRYYRNAQRISRVKHLAQRFLGNRLYHGLYKSISAR